MRRDLIIAGLVAATLHVGAVATIHLQQRSPEAEMRRSAGFEVVLVAAPRQVPAFDPPPLGRVAAMDAKVVPFEPDSFEPARPQVPETSRRPAPDDPAPLATGAAEVRAAMPEVETPLPAPRAPSRRPPLPAGQETSADGPAPDRLASSAAPGSTAESPPVVARNEPPPYPRLARRRGEEGTVILRVQVLATGRVGAIELRKSCGHRRLDEAARQAVTRWTFEPGTRAGRPATSWVDVPVEFRLE